MRELLGKYGNLVDPCPAASYLHLARRWNDDYKAESSPLNLHQARYGYERVLEDGCYDCRQEAQAGLKALPDADQEALPCSNQ